MDENNIEVMNDTEMMNEMDTEGVSSGNSFNAGVAAVGAAVLGGLVFGTVKVIKKIKAKKAARSDAGDTATEQEPKKDRKGLKLGKNKQVVIIDLREQNPEKDSDEK